MTTTGQCPATRGRQTCASIGPHARHVWTDPQPDAEPATEPDQALVEAVAKAVHDVWCQPDCGVPGHQDTLNRLNADEAAAAITAVRAWDAEHGGTAACPDPCDHGHSFDEHSLRHDGSVTCSRCHRRIHYDGTVCECIIPASPGVPRCNGRVWLDTDGRFRDPCTLPLGHHGGCR